MKYKLPRLIVLFIVLITLFFSSTTKKTYAAISEWQKSGTVQPQSTTDFSSDSFKQSLNNLKATGANHVTLIIPYQQTSVTSHDLNRRWDTPTDESLRAGIQYAHSIGLAVTLKIHAEVSTGEWRADINPSNRDEWYKRYSEIMNYYGQIGQQTGVEQICIGAELYKAAASTQHADNTSRWKTMIASLRNVYKGSLTYSANHGAPGEFGEIGFWDVLDYMGNAAYFPLDPQNDNPTVESLKQSWDGVMKNLVKPTVDKWQKPLLFTEVGYRSVSGAHKEPFSWWRDGNADEALQAKLYEALFSYWNTQSYMKGVHLWEWTSNPSAGGPQNKNYTPQNKQAEGVMKQYFGGGGATPTPTPTTSPTQSAQPTSNPSSTPSNTSFKITATASPSSPVVNTNAKVTVNVQPNTAVQDNIVDIEIYNSSDQKVFQKVYDHQNISANNTASYTFDWTPNATGNYLVKVGIFNSNWNGLRYWENSAAAITVVSQASITPSATPQPSTTPTSTPAIGTYSTSFWNVPGTGTAPLIPSRSPDATRNDSQINFNWGQSSPMANINADHFITRWVKQDNFSAGTYQFRTESDDGIRVYVDNQLVIDQWNDHGVTVHTGNKQISAGTHEIKVEFYDNTFDAVAKMSYSLNATSNPTATPVVTASPKPTIAPTASPTTAPTSTPNTTPQPTQSSAQIDIWWPSNNATISGSTPFKALVQNMSLSNYKLYWQVDGGSLNEMADSQQDYPHRESLVNVSGWNWRANGPYKINFVAKDNSGNTLTQKDILVYISR